MPDRAKNHTAAEFRDLGLYMYDAVEFPARDSLGAVTMLQLTDAGFAIAGRCCVRPKIAIEAIADAVNGNPEPLYKIFNDAGIEYVPTKGYPAEIFESLMAIGGWTD